MSVGVFTPDIRITFVEKSAGEVGGGTAWPMLVTLDQIAEIWFRVKDAEFIQGSAYQSDGDPLAAPAAGFAVHAPYTQSTNRAYGVSGEGFIFRGYTTPTEDGTATISAHNDAYIQAEYDRGDLEMWRDIDSNERGMWLEGDVMSDILPYWNEKDGLWPPKNAFSVSCETFATTTDSNFFLAGLTLWAPPVEPFFNINPLDPVTASVVFSGEVAIVRENPSDGFYAPTNLFYLGVKLYANAYEPSGDLTISTDLADFAGTPTEVCKYKIRLFADAAGTPPVPVYLECPIYMEDWQAATDEGYDTFGGIDFIHAATEWWPYAKNSPAEPVWNSATGAKL